MPLTEEREESGGLDSFVERRKQKFREVRLYLDKRHDDKVGRPRPGQRGHLSPFGRRQGREMLLRVGARVRQHPARGMKLEYELHTGPWEVTDMLHTCIPA